MTKSMLMAVAIISILFNVIGLLGAYKEHFCLTLTYAFLMTLNILGSILVAVKTPTYFYSTVFNFIVCVLAYDYAIDLRFMRNPICVAHDIVTPAQNQTFVQMNPIYNDQQYSISTGGWVLPVSPTGEYLNPLAGWETPPPAYNEET